MNKKTAASQTDKIHFGENNFKALNKFLETNFQGKKMLILVDDHTRNLCLPNLLAGVPILGSADIFEIRQGETSKNLENCGLIWEHLSSLSYNRNDLIINLGGGVVSDIGGFVASTFKRGMPYINIPTTVLGQVDASIGGKTGVNYLHLKNLIGVINFPKAIFIYADFINTLPSRQVRSGFAEVIKTALIYDKELWYDINAMPEIELSKLPALTKSTAEIKEAIVKNDPEESGLRKILNFGHTIGHALETHSLKHNDEPCLHGEAIAMGMICEAFISYRLNGITKVNLDQIIEVISRHFNKISFEKNIFPDLLGLMKKDKKNVGDDYNFTLLDSIGTATFDNSVEENIILDSLKFLYHLQY